MAEGLDLADAETSLRLHLLPYPRQVNFHGAPFKHIPACHFYISANATGAVRSKCHSFCQKMEAMGRRMTLGSSAQLKPTQALFTQSAIFQKWEQMDRPLRGEVANPEGYRLTVTSEGALLYGADEQGFQYAGSTLRQLIEDGLEIPGLEIEDFPILPWRVMHLDFKGWPPTREYLKKTINILADLKINALILEYESFFDFPSQPGLASVGALTKDDISDLELCAHDLGVTLIPLVSCIGNVGHILKLPGYAALREHPEYYQQFNPVNPATFDVVSAMIEDLISIQPGKHFHIGGDETRLLGSNSATEARAKQLGGKAALYLEYVGKISRYLISRDRLPLIWDDMFRKMTDDQIRWLPPEAVLTFWQYDGHGGHATPAILTNLERYKRLGRRVWGAATRCPSSRYDSFDNIDAWTEAAELGYMEGLITTAWTRDHALGALFAPPEIAWPGAFYAAERVWSGIKTGPTRNQFPQRFIVRMFGTKDPSSQSRLWAAFDLLMREHPRRARQYLAHDVKQVTRNRETLAFLDVWVALGAFKEYLSEFEDSISGNYANFQVGRGDPLHSGRLCWRVIDTKKKLPAIMRNFSLQASRLTHETVVQEYLESSVAYGLKRLDEMESLLGGYPVPNQEWQQPVHL